MCPKFDTVLEPLMKLSIFGPKNIIHKANLSRVGKFCNIITFFSYNDNCKGFYEALSN